MENNKNTIRNPVLILLLIENLALEKNLEDNPVTNSNRKEVAVVPWAASASAWDQVPLVLKRKSLIRTINNLNGVNNYQRKSTKSSKKTTKIAYQIGLIIFKWDSVKNEKKSSIKDINFKMHFRKSLRSFPKLNIRRWMVYINCINSTPERFRDIWPSTSFKSWHVSRNKFCKLQIIRYKRLLSFSVRSFLAPTKSTRSHKKTKTVSLIK